MTKVLVAGYGGGHVRALIPVVTEMAKDGVQTKVLGLTTALEVFRAQGIEAVGLAELIEGFPGFLEIMQKGEELAQGLAIHPAVGYLDTCAYLGVGFIDLVASVGEEKARQAFNCKGRKAFEPVETCKTIIDMVQPDLVLTTNSPRMEKAFVHASRELSVPSVVLVDSVAVNEASWLAKQDYGDRICVFHQNVKDRLSAAGRSSSSIFVTGNPAFDDLVKIKKSENTNGYPNILYLAQTENSPGQTERVGKKPNSVFNQTIDTLVEAVESKLCSARVRLHPNQSVMDISIPACLEISGPDRSFIDDLSSANLVLTASSTGGFQAQAIGILVLQIGWSPRSSMFKYSDFGPSVSLERPADLRKFLENNIAAKDPDGGSWETLGIAAQRVTDVIYSLFD